MELGIVGPAEPSDFSPPWQPSEWAVANHLHYSSVSSQFPSVKSQRAVMCESLLENGMACLLECDAGVLKFREQPIGPSWHDGDGWREGTARDFWVVSRHGPVLVETKYARELADIDVRSRLRQMAQSYRVTHGIRMLVFSEKTIFQEPRLENCRILLRYAGGEDRALEVDLRDLLNGYLSPMSVMDFVSKFEPGRRDRVLGGLCRLALAGDVSFDISKPVDRHAMVYWSRQ